MLAIGLAGCSSTESPSTEPDRVVLQPPSESAAGHTHAPGTTDAGPLGDGTRVAVGAYRLADAAVAGDVDAMQTVSFRLLGPDGPVTELEVEQTKLVHLYVVRTDLAVFRHLHPVLVDERRGVWETRVDLGEPGDYRVIAEVRPTGSDRPVVLGGVATVTGDWQPEPMPSVTGVAHDGVVRVAVDGTGEVGPDGRLHLVVTDLAGNPVTLGTYLGAAAHVTGFSLTDGAVVHVHPYGEPEVGDDGTRLTFHTTFAEADDYRFFVQVRVDGFLHTVPVTASVR